MSAGEPFGKENLFKRKNAILMLWLYFTGKYALFSRAEPLPFSVVLAKSVARKCRGEENLCVFINGNFDAIYFVKILFTVSQRQFSFTEIWVLNFL